MLLPEQNDCHTHDDTYNTMHRKICWWLTSKWKKMSCFVREKKKQ